MSRRHKTCLETCHEEMSLGGLGDMSHPRHMQLSHNGDPIRPSKWHRVVGGRLCHGHVVLVLVMVVVVFARFDSDTWE